MSFRRVIEANIITKLCNPRLPEIPPVKTYQPNVLRAKFAKSVFGLERVWRRLARNYSFVDIVSAAVEPIAGNPNIRTSPQMVERLLNCLFLEVSFKTSPNVCNTKVVIPAGWISFHLPGGAPGHERSKVPLPSGFGTDVKRFMKVREPLNAIQSHIPLVLLETEASESAPEVSLVVLGGQTVDRTWARTQDLESVEKDVVPLVIWPNTSSHVHQYLQKVPERTWHPRLGICGFSYLKHYMTCDTVPLVFGTNCPRSQNLLYLVEEVGFDAIFVIKCKGKMDEFCHFEKPSGDGCSKQVVLDLSQACILVDYRENECGKHREACSTFIAIDDHRQVYFMVVEVLHGRVCLR